MLSALLYLRLISLQNWLIRRLSSLRQPKQLAGAVMFGAYLWFFFLRRWDTAPAHAPQRRAAEDALTAANISVAAPTDWLPAVSAVGAVAMLVFTALMWILPRQRAALGFSEAEIAFLFPAPIKRQTLVHFRLLTAQFRGLIGAIVMMLISNRWTFLGGNVLTHALGWWFVFTALSLHHSGAGFTLTRLGDAGLRIGVRRLLILAAIAAVVALTLARIPAPIRFPDTNAPAVLPAFMDWLEVVTSTAPLNWVLLPFKLVLGPFLAADVRGFFVALAPALLVIVAHYLWVVKTAVAFEEAAIERAEKRSARIAAWRSGQRHFGSGPATARRAPFRLGNTGRPELAFLWKNLLSTWPYFNLRVFAIAAFAVTAICFWLNRQPALHGLLPVSAAAAAGIGVYLLIIGPQFARQDIRSDLSNADILKTYPLPGWQIILGELLTPVAILTGFVWLALLTATLSFRVGGVGHEIFTVADRLVCAAWLALATPALVTLQLLVPSAGALLFPAWFQTSRGHGGGPEVAGQRMIFFFAQAVTMLLALLPPTALAALLLFILLNLLDLSLMVAVSLAAIPFLLLLIAEVACGVWLLGQRFEKFDLSAELRS